MTNVNATGQTNGVRSIAINGEQEAIDCECMDRVVKQLNEISKKATFDLAMTVGNLVIGAFYGGSVDAWRQRGPKVSSFRKLAQHPGLSMSPSTLYRCVAVYELCDRIGIGRENALSTSHYQLVLPLPNSQQHGLLCRAATESWSVRRLRDEIARMPVSGAVSKGGRKRSMPLQKMLRTLETCLEDVRDLSAIEDGLSPAVAETLATVAARLAQRCTAIEARMQRHAESKMMKLPSPAEVAPSPELRRLLA